MWVSGSKAAASGGDWGDSVFSTHSPSRDISQEFPDCYPLSQSCRCPECWWTKVSKHPFPPWQPQGDQSWPTDTTFFSPNLLSAELWSGVQVTCVRGLCWKALGKGAWKREGDPSYTHSNCFKNFPALLDITHCLCTKHINFCLTSLAEMKWSESCSVVFDSSWPHGLKSPWNSSGQNTRVVAVPFSRGSSQPRNQIQVSHIAGRFFTSWATREAQEYWSG